MVLYCYGIYTIIYLQTAALITDSAEESASLTFNHLKFVIIKRRKKKNASRSNLGSTIIFPDLDITTLKIVTWKN